MPKPKKIAPRAKPRRAAPTTSPAVYTLSPLPPRTWAIAPHRGELAILSELGLLCPGHVHPSEHTDYIQWWHATYAIIEQGALAAAHAAISENNADVAALASGLDLTIKTYAHDAARVLQFDAVAMARRIEAASAKHKNKGPRNHAGANRHLAYHCPTCSVPKTKPDGSVQWSNTVRASAPDRIMMCAGRHGAQHEPALMVFDETSQPAYRLEDKYGHADDLEGDAAIDRALVGVNAHAGHTQTTSALRLARPPRQIVNAAGIVQNNPAPRDDDIPF